MCGVILFYIMMILLIGAASLVTVFALYDVSICLIVSMYALFFIPLALCSIWLSFTALQFIVLLGKRGIEIGFVICWFFVPFSGVFYPVDILPWWAQRVSDFLPMTYVFQGMRAYVGQGQNPIPSLIISTALGTVYALVAILLFLYCFNRSKRLGLARLAD